MWVLPLFSLHNTNKALHPIPDRPGQLVYILCSSKYMCMFSQCFFSFGTTKQALLSWTWQLALKLILPSGAKERGRDDSKLPATLSPHTYTQTRTPEGTTGAVALKCESNLDYLTFPCSVSLFKSFVLPPFPLLSHSSPLTARVTQTHTALKLQWLIWHILLSCPPELVYNHHCFECASISITLILCFSMITEDIWKNKRLLKYLCFRLVLA